ncbi:excalibur calcium-binding domain-containing protein [Streptomyces subrutilus]|uniref:excalibur calcium-binding domain-containing protein n=1 Tax=Streptomyces subrutilus TaxID=36818 RepID=UPI000AD4BD60|nr:excalibur calcium-binding domain-containing protein [Streptomyces subrutilus]
MYPPPHTYASTQPVRRWWQHPALIITLLVILPPVGIALAWTSLWSKPKKIVATILAGIWFFLPFTTASGKKGYEEGKNGKAAATASPSPSVTASPTLATSPPPVSPTPSPTPSAVPVMPSVVGATYDDAIKALEAAGIAKNNVTLDDVYLDIETPTHAKAAGDADWKVCFQTPGNGAGVAAGGTVHLDLGNWSGFSLVKKCPAAKGTSYNIPANDPNYHRDNDTSGGSSSSSGGSSSGGGGSVYYKNCTAVRAAGAAPIRRGDPGYGKHLDRDGDGVACE